MDLHSPFIDERTLRALARRCQVRLSETSCQLALAESCTGGLIGATLSSVSGASAIYLGSVVAYDNRLKQQLLGVSPDTIERYGAVSAPVVRNMAEGVMRLTGADLGLAATGVAGPGGGSEAKPVGTVYLALARAEQPTWVRQHYFEGDREAVRLATTQALLRWVAGLPAEAFTAEGIAPAGVPVGS